MAIKCAFLIPRKGFTMIELLMVIIMVGVLSAVAIPQFLNFRKEGKLAAVQQSLTAMREGIANAKKVFVLRCGAPGDAVPLYSVVYNSLNNGAAMWRSASAGTTGTCDPSTWPPGASTKLWDGPSGAPAVKGLPNPFADSSLALFNLFMTCTGKCSCDDLSNGYIGGAGNYTWIYNPVTAEIWAATNVAGECDL